MIVIKDIFLLNKRKFLLYSITLLVLVSLLPSYFICNRKVLANELNNEILPEYDNTFFIDIKGEVKSPGVYEIREGSRVIDACLLAGGFTDLADTSNTNLAKKVSDEMIVRINKYVPKVIKNNKSSFNENTLIDINNAGLNELLSLPGIGESKANDIIKFRDKSSFNKIEDIQNVSGIGPLVFEKIKDLITV